MRSSIAKTTVTMLGGLILVIALTAGGALAGEAIIISGEMISDPLQLDSAMIGDTEGHSVRLQTYEGSNKSTGGVAFMDGAKTDMVSIADLTHGSGTHRGYVIFTKENNGTSCHLEGKVTTTVDSDGKATTSYEGTFSFTGGTGEYENIMGEGTYEGKFTPDGALWATWSGEYTLQE